MANKYKALYQRSLLEVEGLINKINDMQFNPATVCNFAEQQYTQMLKIQDRAICANRFVWKNLPSNLTSQQLESMFYDFGSLCFFEKDGILSIARYSVVGGLNKYGKLDKVIPITFDGKTQDTEKSVIDFNKPPTDSDFAVIINDYTPHSFSDISTQARSVINLATTIRDEVAVYSQLKTNIMLSVKKWLAMCQNESQSKSIKKQVSELLDANNPIVAIATSKGKGNLDLLPVEMFNFDNNFDTQNYCQQIDFYNKVRRNFNGVPSPDTFEKKERKITAEAENTSMHSNITLLDGLMQRQNGLELIKKFMVNIKGVNDIEVEISKPLMEILNDSEEFEEGDDNE